jgi:hypothetical protein
VRHAVGIVLAVAAVSSLVYAVLLVAADPQEAYFSTPARAWELALGGCLAVTLATRRLGGRAAVLAAWAGAIGIAVAIVSFGESTAVPGLPTLLPTLGAAALVAAGSASSRSLPTRALQLRPVQYLGRISYAWYVWHWPVLVFADARWGPLATPARLAVVIAALVPALITNRLIEEPLRRVRIDRRRARLTLLAAPAAALTMVGTSAALVSSLPTVEVASVSSARGAARFSSAGDIQRTATALRPPPREADADRSRAFEDGCLVDKADTEPPPCVYGDPDSPAHVVLLGDSHAMQYFPALERIAALRHWRLVLFTKSGCPAADAGVDHRFRGKPYPECPVWRAEVLRRIEEVERPQLVVVGGMARYRVAKDGHPLSSARTTQVLAAGYAAVLRRLRRVAREVVVVRDPPRPPQDVPSCVAEHLAHLSACAFPQRAGSVERDPIVAGARRAAVTRVLDPRERLCAAGTCPAVIGNVLVYRHTGHLTATYVATMTPWFKRRLAGLDL